jgi:hypothetical protein
MAATNKQTKDTPFTIKVICACYPNFNNWIHIKYNIAN